MALKSAPVLVVFPSAEPTMRSGPGALLWSAPRGCKAGGGGEAVGATLGRGDVPSRARPLVAGSDLTAVAAATGTAAGQVVVAGTGGLSEGRDVGAFSAPRPLGGLAAPVAAFSGYLGDAAIASSVRTRAGWAIAVRVQRHYDDTLSAARLVPVGRHPIAALVVTLDFRAEALLVWASGGAIYACELPQSGPAQPAHRLAQLETGWSTREVWALLSDDGHAIVAWRTQSVLPSRPASRPPGESIGQRSGRESSTAIELSIAAAGLAFGAPHTLERYRDPGGFVPPVGSSRLIRLSSEAVMLAWTGVRDGRYAVLASPVSLHRGAWAPVAISESAPAAGRGTAALGSAAAASAAGGSSPTQEAVLSDVAPGPDAEAVAVWRVAPRLPEGAPGRAGSGRANPGSWAIRAARGHYAGRGEVSFDAPEQVAPAGADGPPAVAIDPATGRAFAAWVSLAGAPHVEYAVREPAVAPSASANAIPATALACCLGLPYASIDSSAIRIGTPLAACLK
ncbi:MAG TPA: hypothetical protein VNV37_04355 [Solirubrobacteraceae bacterium]|nr:hypothetical protein [Solirubrobacteraceae bacterium]